MFVNTTNIFAHDDCWIKIIITKMRLNLRFDNRKNGKKKHIDVC